MSILMDSAVPVKPYMTVKYKGNGLWIPWCETRRGGMPAPRYCFANNRATAVAAAQSCALQYGWQFKEPEPDPEKEHIILCAWCNEKGVRTVVSVKPCPPYKPGEDYGGICPACVKEQEEKMWKDGAPDDLIESFAEFAERGVPLYAKGFGEIEEGVREYTDWMR